jgi:integrase
MTAYNRGSRGWYVDFTLDYPDGTKERVRRKAPLNTKRDAEGFERDLQRELLEAWRRKAMGLGEEVPTVAQFEEEFFGVLEGEGLKRSTLDSYRTIMRMHIGPHFGSMRLHEISPRDVEAFKRSRAKLTPKTIRNHLAVLSKVFSTARRLDIIRETPHVEMPRQQPHTGVDFWSFEEVERVLEQLPSEPLIEHWVRLALACGLRCGELTALQWGDVDLKQRQVVVRRQLHKLRLSTPKSNRLRVVPLSQAAVDAFEAQRPRTFMRAFGTEDDWVFQDEVGYVTLDRVKRGFWRVVARAGVKRIRLHDLRHTFASHCVMRGVPIEVLQQWLGHSDIRMTMRYAHLAPGHTHRFVELLDAPVGAHGTHTAPRKTKPPAPA